ncbi:MAG: helix-turn-helix transcriptional regulator [Erysipelotrichaceae bacterium]|jgi:transcriptional regulator with XRE-family HTH domain|nr:helix-turn-helix transcriptional regulator [Bacillota bacterium]MDY0118784.1 helix-turn-helix transcriptional regulator [Bacilli bacterium]NLJ32531.1 helix-turn-helix transcriptional regulator [Erysipelotrichaceae bacterium]
MDYYKSLGIRIRKLRVDRGWSQLDLSLEANINRNYICDLENGRRNPTLEMIIRIADAFEIEISELLKL